jgi:hypothetical protein
MPAKGKEYPPRQEKLSDGSNSHPKYGEERIDLGKVGTAVISHRVT